MRIREFRAWLPGLACALFGGGLLLLLGIWLRSFGFGLTLGLPAFLGGMLASHVTVGRLGAQVSLGLLLVTSLAGGLVALNLAGVYCSLILLAILTIPLLLAIGLVVVVIRLLDGAKKKKTRTLPSILLFFSVAGLIAFESRVANLPSSVEVIETRRVLPMSTTEVWESLVFYEEVRLEPPALARIGLPTPLYAEGRVERVGDVKRCIYQGGYLVKEISDYDPGRLLAFDVLEQVGVEDRSADLISGSFALKAMADGRTEVTLTTVYRPLLQARPIWRPFEQATAHALHNHVLDGIELGVPRPFGIRLADSRR